MAVLRFIVLSALVVGYFLHAGDASEEELADLANIAVGMAIIGNYVPDQEEAFSMIYGAMGEALIQGSIKNRTFLGKFGVLLKKRAHESSPVPLDDHTWAFISDKITQYLIMAATQEKPSRRKTSRSKVKTLDFQA